MRYPWVTWGLFILLAGAASAKVVYVDRNAPGSTRTGTSWATAFPTIAQAMSAAVSGDEIWVAAGTYNEQVNLKPGIGLYGGFIGLEIYRDQRLGIPSLTVIDGQGRFPNLVTINNGSTSTVLDGFTIRNAGGQNSSSAGVGVNGGSPVIAHNVITGNVGLELGGGVFLLQTSARVVDNVIAGNAAAQKGTGGGIYASGGKPVIVNNTIVGNAAAYSAGLLLSKTTAVVENNLIAFNSSGVGIPDTTLPPGAIYRNNNVYGNTAGNYDAGGLLGRPGLDQTGKNGNISLDPLLAGYTYGNMHIQPGSPCIDAGDDSAVATGDTDIDLQPRIMGAHVDIGADESDGRMWTVRPRVVRVSPNGNDANDGSSWTVAKKTIQAGIAVAADQGGEVWVAAGSYFGDRTITLLPFAWLYGGFAGTETAREQRDWNANATFLTTQPNLSSGAALTVVGGNRVSGVDGFVVVPSGPISATPTLIGISCAAGAPILADNVVAGFNGAGISIGTGAPLLFNNAIASNGLSTTSLPRIGGIYCETSSPTISNNLIEGNSSTGQSAPAITVFGGTGVSIRDNLIRNNTNASTATTNPAGIALNSSTGTVANNTFVNNRGTAIYVQSPLPGTASMVVANNIVAFGTTGIYAPTTISVSIRNNCVYGNGKDYALSDLTGKNGNIRAYPGFVDMLHEDYSLAPTSPCRDAGDDTVPLPGEIDLHGAPRVQGRHVDIGAYEVPDATLYYHWWDVATALKIAGGFRIASPDEAAFYGANGQGRPSVDMNRVIAIARQVMGVGR